MCILRRCACSSCLVLLLPTVHFYSICDISTRFADLAPYGDLEISFFFLYLIIVPETTFYAFHSTCIHQHPLYEKYFTKSQQIPNQTSVFNFFIVVHDNAFYSHLPPCPPGACSLIIHSVQKQSSQNSFS